MKAVIYGCVGETLTEEEKDFFRGENPFGFILFARNCVKPDQVRTLVAQLHEVTGREQLAVLVDQEGGRVARLKPPHWRASPPAAALAAIAAKDREGARRAVYLNARLIAHELSELGITVDCAPLADIPAEGSHAIIGDRAYGTEPAQVIALARAMAEGLMDGGVLPVLKHIPGHGRALVDSHESLPVVEEPLPVLERTDFMPFHALRDLPFGMTAHILYTALDSEKVATLSPKAIRYIREKIGFDGMLMSDDLSMKALKGGLSLLARESLSAGCDLVLHCSGDMAEMREVASGTAELSPQARRRMGRAWSQHRAPLGFDAAQAQAQLGEIMKAAA